MWRLVITTILSIAFARVGACYTSVDPIDSCDWIVWKWKAHHTPEREYYESELVFTGKVVGTKVLFDGDDFIQGRIYSVLVTEVLKGATSNLVEIHNENDSGRFDMEDGHSYLLFAYKGTFDGFIKPMLAIDAAGNSCSLQDSKHLLVAVRELQDRWKMIRMLTGPNQSTDPALTSVTPAAGQPACHP
jgi:hypothetical protein